jgi:hypothetical protein
MKLSDFSTDKCGDVLCEITPYASNIITDEKLLDTFKETVDTKGMTRIAVLLVAAERYTTVIPILLKTHRTDLYNILATLNEITVEDVGKQNIMVTLEQVRDALQDEVLMRFFKSLRGQVKTE